MSRLATGIENRDPAAIETLCELAPGHARIIGITGPPGAGKSTLVDSLALELRRQGKTLAILAVDPTSRISGGAILGDRIRMQRHHADPGIFIRSMATRGTMGGLARATADLARLMDAAGRDYILIETVGVGQDEISVAGVAQVTVVVLVPGMGDDIQAIKAGIMEIADIFVINKSDHPGADRVEFELHAEGFTCPVLRTVATTGQGISELLQALDKVGQTIAFRGLSTAPALDHLGVATAAAIEQALAFYQSLGLEEIDPGLHHIALRVPDLAAAVARLEARGARLLHPPQPLTGGQLHVFVHPSSTGGILLELIQENNQ